MPRLSKNLHVREYENSVTLAVAKQLRIRRGLAGLSQSDLARMLGVTFQQVQKYESGANRLTLGKLLKISEIFKVPVQNFFEEFTEFGEPSPDCVNRLDLDTIRLLNNAPTEIVRTVRQLLQAVINKDEIEAEISPSQRKPNPAPLQGTNRGPVKRRRKRNSVWDPEDIYKAKVLSN